MAYTTASAEQERRLAAARSVDGLIAAHDAFLARIAAQCLLRRTAVGGRRASTRVVGGLWWLWWLWLLLLLWWWWWWCVCMYVCIYMCVCV